MSDSKFDKLRYLVFNDKIEIKSSLLEGCQCIICGDILIDAQVAPCECRYCRICINKHLQNGADTCPGNTEDCKLENLSDNLSVDHVTNKKILNIIVKCPKPNCHHECELREMTEHLRICENRSEKCPFEELGCLSSNVLKSQMVDHLQNENENHSKIVVNLINNMMNEMKRIENSYKRDINILKEELQKKDDKIDQLIEFCSNELQQGTEKLDKETSKLLKITNNIQIENERLNSLLEKSLQFNKDVMMDLQFVGMKLSSKLGSLTWKIDKVSEKKKKKEIISSEYFYSHDGHKMILYFYPCGCSKHTQDDHLSVKLCMSSYQCNETLAYAGDVNVEIFDQQNGMAIQKSKKMCKIDKGFSGPPFNFLYDQLPLDRALRNDSIIFRCCLISVYE